MINFTLAAPIVVVQIRPLKLQAGGLQLDQSFGDLLTYQMIGGYHMIVSWHTSYRQAECDEVLDIKRHLRPNLPSRIPIAKATEQGMPANPSAGD